MLLENKTVNTRIETYFVQIFGFVRYYILNCHVLGEYYLENNKQAECGHNKNKSLGHFSVRRKKNYIKVILEGVFH